MKIIIIGGGIGGLALALFLKKVKIECAVYEAHPLKQNVGGGLNIAPNGMSVIEALGLADKLYIRGSIALENRFLNEKGEIIARYNNFDPKKYGLPGLSITRHDLFDVLLKECESKAISVFFKKRLTDIKEHDNGVTAYFEDETSAYGDVLIGADGINSATRRLIFPDGPNSQYTGVISSGGVVRGDDVPDIGTHEKQSLNFVFGAKGFFGYMGIRNGDLMWWANLYRDNKLSNQQLAGMTVESTKKEMTSIFKDFNKQVTTLIDKTEITSNYNIFDMPELEKWHKDRVLLIGDAVHAVSPNAGQGASMALEDAMYLAKLFKNPDSSYEEIFAAFENGRKQRTEKIVKEGRRRGNQKKEITPFQSKVREKILKIIFTLFGEKQQEWLYSYKIDWGE